MEVTDKKTGEKKFEQLWNEVAPDFLSGTTNKTRFYTGDPYYKNRLRGMKFCLLMKKDQPEWMPSLSLLP